MNNQKGQAMIEYLVLVAFMAIAAMGILRVLNSSVNARFTNITNAIQGRNQTEVRVRAPSASVYHRRDMSSFFRGAIGNESNSSRRNSE